MNYNSNNLIIIALFTSVLLLSCGTKEKYEDLQSSISEIEQTAEKLSPDEWAKYDKEIEQTKEKLKTGHEKYTPEEKEKMNKLIGKYYALKAKHKVGNLKQELQDATQQLQGAYDAIFNKNGKPTSKQQ
jgi:predicted nuclease with TOPRIM domain